MEPRLVRLDDTLPRPWRNGGGRARDLLVRPAGGAWQVQVSVADVEADGPFSHFPGVERWFAVVSGADVELVVDGVAQRLTKTSPPLRFDGAAATTCRLLDGPTRDLNLMLRGVRGGLERALDSAPWRPAATQCGLFAATAGQCRIGTRTIDVPVLSLLWFDAAPTELAFFAAMPGPDANAWWIAAAPEAAP